MYMQIITFDKASITAIMDSYIARNRPAEHIRPQLDLGYCIKGRSIIIFEIRPVWLNPEEIMEAGRAKATFVKLTGQWKVYWIRASLKWDLYPVKPVVNTLNEFVKLVEEDKLGCFWG